MLGKPTAEIAQYIGSLLRVPEIPDDGRALNGLQVANSGTVTRIGAAVDACRATIEMARNAGANLLLVHHGMFWGGLEPLTGLHGDRVRLLTSADIAVYSAHLPLDCHPEFGNNPILGKRIGLQDVVPFGSFEGSSIGVAGNLVIPRAGLGAIVRQAIGVEPRVLPTGPDLVRRVGVVTGAGSSALREAAAQGVDTLLTGEAPHHAYLLAEELGVNLVLAGHYATETVGVQALAAHLSERFGLPWLFLDHPTGL